VILHTLAIIGVIVAGGWLLGTVAMAIADRVTPSKGNTEKRQ
jgi:hypothetical protein